MGFLGKYSWSLYHIERRLDELLKSKAFWSSVPALEALSAGRFLEGRQYDFGDQARIDEMLRVLARRERAFAPAPIDRHEFRMIDRKGTKRLRQHPASQAHRGIHQATASYRQGWFVEHDLGGSLGSAVDAARRAGYPWTEQMARKMLRNVEKRGVQAARNGPSPPPTPAGGPVAKPELGTADRLGSRERAAGATHFAAPMSACTRSTFTRTEQAFGS
jgi:hypothetical protein